MILLYPPLMLVVNYQRLKPPSSTRNGTMYGAALLRVRMPMNGMIPHPCFNSACQLHPKGSAVFLLRCRIILLPSSHAFADSRYSDCNRKYEALMKLLRAIGNDCPLCWFRQQRVTTRHWAYNCPSGTCRTEEWKKFKQDLTLPEEVVCHFCGVPWHDMFNHSPPSSKAKVKCRYGDKLKELAYLIYMEDESIRSRVFSQIGETCPRELTMYAAFLEVAGRGGCLNFIELIVAYWDLRK